MHPVERVIRYIRHSPILKSQDWLWEFVRPSYDRLLANRCAKRGIERRIGDGPALRILPEFRAVSEQYEEDIFRGLMEQIRPGDVAVDIGAHIGLYTMAMAHAVGPLGNVIAFEPDRTNLGVLSRHLSMNSLADKIQLVESAVGDEDATIGFAGDRSSVSRVAAPGDVITGKVIVIKLDTYFRGRAVDVLKLDVEGYEGQVLNGASELLSDPLRRPRLIFIEMHPHLWATTDTTRTEILQILEKNDYNIETIHGSLLAEDETSEIAASAKHPRRGVERTAAS
jgi:FkbM family methyltransferase